MTQFHAVMRSKRTPHEASAYIRPLTRMKRSYGNTYPIPSKYSQGHYTSTVSGPQSSLYMQRTIKIVVAPSSKPHTSYLFCKHSAHPAHTKHSSANLAHHRNVFWLRVRLRSRTARARRQSHRHSTHTIQHYTPRRSRRIHPLARRNIALRRLTSNCGESDRFPRQNRRPSE